jgi:TatD DNase family protein
MPPMAPLFDTHCHLQDARFAMDLEAVLERARVVGVTHLACCGSAEHDWARVLELAREHTSILPMLGLHPWYVGEARPEWAASLAGLLRTNRAGVGEVGLDFALEDTNRELQEAVLRTQLRLARELDRPLSLHCRRAWERLLLLLREEGLPAAGAVIHAYSGSPETARELQALGAHIAFGCSLANPANHRGAKAVRAVAEDRLLLETDAPDIPPRHLPDWGEGRPNEPANLPLVLEAAARLRGDDPERLGEAVHANACRVFAGLMRD